MSGTTNLKTSLVMSVFLMAMLFGLAAGQTIYVDASASAGGNGQSWATAYKYLQDGLADADSGEEIWVAAGRHEPDANSADPNGSRDRAATFTLINGVGIYGGFPSGGDPNWSDRDPETYETILSGDINTPGDINDNSYHVVTSSSVDSNTIIDGFTVMGGNADGTMSSKNCGGGIYSINSNPIIVNCTITRNTADIYGGGMHNEDGSPELTGCTFTDNAAESGGGMYNDSWNDPAAGNRVILTDCTFSGNSSLVAGGAIFNLYCDSILTDCVFEDNSTVPGASGGGGMCNDQSLTRLTSCTFSGNSTSNGAGGGLYNRENSDANVVDCIFTGNSAYYYGCGMYNRGDAIVVNCTFSGNSGALYTHSKGGGIADYYGDSLTVVNCIFTGNSAGFGGGMFNRRSSSTNVINCAFSSNSATWEGDGGGIYNRDCDPVITNCIIWGNYDDQIYNYYSTADPNVTYSCVQGSYPGTGNISSNPMFGGSGLHLGSDSPCIDAGNNDALPRDSLDVDDDGDTTELIPWDRAFKLRRADDPAVNPDTGNAGTIGLPVVDMGAYELSLVFVDDDANLGGDGASWTTAFKYLQDGLNAAGGSANGASEIRVAQGTYKPDQDEGSIVTPGNRAETFRMQKSLAIRGSYRGLAGRGNPHSRNFTTFETILTGDLTDNDEPNDPNSNNENSYHVLMSEDTDTSSILEGFTVTAGNADGVDEEREGGGMYNYNNSNPTVTNCTFRCNSAHFRGGAIFHLNESIDDGIILTDCIFVGNTAAHSGGGMYAVWNVTLTNCTFTGNSAGEEGGGLLVVWGDTALSNCSFSGNSAKSGGGISNFGISVLTAINCTFSGNLAQENGGAIVSEKSFRSRTVNLTNCTFSGNRANAGGGVYSSNGEVHSFDMTLNNCILWGNSDSNGVDESAQIFASDPNVEVLVYYCCIQGCSTYCLDANDRNIGEDPLFLREPNNGGDGWSDDPCTPSVDEGANDDYGDLRLRAGSPCIDTGNNDADTNARTYEIEPLPDTDLDGRPRFADGDCNDTNTVDMGAYEFTSTYIGDFDVDCDVDFVDYAIFANYWQTDELLVDIAPTPAGDGIIDERDLNILCENWIFGK